jgi:hypothetical protein
MLRIGYLRILGRLWTVSGGIVIGLVVSWSLGVAVLVCLWQKNEGCEGEYCWC